MRAAKVDANQKEIVAALRAVGATVQHLHMVGRGCPDILVGYSGKNYLIEIKTVRGELTPQEGRFIADWRGQVCVIRTIRGALEEIGAAWG